MFETMYGEVYMENYLERELYQLIKTESYIFDFLQDSTMDGLWYWDLDKPENEWMNKRFWITLGHDPEKMPHKASAWQHIINQEDLKIALDNFSKHIKDPEHPYDQVVRYTHKDGSTVWIRCRGMAVRDKNGKPLRMLGAHHNITEQKKAELALTELNATKDKLISVISHDLRTPFNAILGFTHMLLDNVESYSVEEIKTVAGYIAKTGENTLELLNNLLEWSKLQSGALIYKPQNINIKPLILEVIDQHTPAALLKNISFNHDCIGNSTIYADSGIITIVLRNLISNAIKFTHSGGAILVHADCKADSLEVKVSDNGVGMDKDKIEKLFIVGHNSSTSGTANETGSGLGLILCKEFIELQDGTINVSSEPGKGSTFTFSLPCMC